MMSTKGTRAGTVTVVASMGALVLVFGATQLGCSPEASTGGDVGAVSDGGAEGHAASDELAEQAPEKDAQVAPDFELVSLSGETVRLADLRGQTVVIDFWATWCPPCEFQVPELNAFFLAHRDESDVTVLGISVDVEGPEVVGQWTGERDVKYRVLLGGEDVARQYGAVGFPTLYIIAPDGTVDSVHVGLIETGDLEEALARQRTSASS